MVLLPETCVDDIIGFNDLTTDEAGRIYAGSLGASPFGPEAGKKTGCLHLVDLDGSHRVLSTGIRLTNGLGFSPGGETLYHADSGRHRVGGLRGAGRRRHRGSGEISRSSTTAFRTALAVDAEGGRGGSPPRMGARVLRFDSEGGLRQRVPCPHPMPTSVCFGGEDLLDLYVVTGTAGTGRDDSGTIYRIRVDVPGLPVPPSRVALRPSA